MAGKKIHRPLDERVAEIDAKIVKYEDLVIRLKEKREKLLTQKPKHRGKVGMATAIKKAKEYDITPQQLIELIENSQINND